MIQGLGVKWKNAGMYLYHRQTEPVQVRGGQFDSRQLLDDLSQKPWMIENEA